MGKIGLVLVGVDVALMSRTLSDAFLEALNIGPGEMKESYLG